MGKYKVFGVPRVSSGLGYIESILHTEIIELISDMTSSHQTYHGNGYQRRIQTFVIIFPNRRKFPELIICVVVDIAVFGMLYFHFGSDNYAVKSQSYFRK